MGSLLKSQAVKKNCWHLAGMVQGFCLSEREKNPVNLGISSLFLPKSLSNSNPLAPSVLSINKQPSEGARTPRALQEILPLLSSPPHLPPLRVFVVSLADKAEVNSPNPLPGSRLALFFLRFRSR